MKRVRLDELLDIKRGGSPRPISKFTTDDPNGINWIKISDTTDSKFITGTKEKIIPEGVEKSRFVKPGDFLLTNSMSFGRPYILKTEGCIHDGWLVLRPKSDNVLDDYLYYILGSPTLKREFEKQAKGTTVKNLNISLVSKVEIPLPSLSEQKAIVAKLDQAQRLIDIDREMLSTYDELIQSVFLEMFGEAKDNKVPISSLVKLNPRKSEINDINKSIEASFLGMANVGENGSLNLAETKTAEEAWKGYTYFQENDVLFAKITPCMENGKGAIAKGLKNGLGFGSTEFHVLRPIEGVSKASWIYHLTHSNKFRQIAESFMRGSAGQKRVPTHFFDKFKIAKPSIEKQEEFERIAQKITHEKKELRNLLVQSQELFSSLVQKSFDYE